MKKIFDFLIIGGGSAGSVLANRLSENPANEVLVIEAGSTDYLWDFRLLKGLKEESINLKEDF